jgi:uncharacterized RDD family membrane protein YckC
MSDEETVASGGEPGDADAAAPATAPAPAHAAAPAAAPPPPVAPPPPDSDGASKGFGFNPPPQGTFSTPSFGGDLAVPYASWGRRVGGYVIDAILYLVVDGILDKAIKKGARLHVTMHSGGVVHRHTISVDAIVISLVVSLVYATILIGSRRGQTVGMMLVNVRARRDEGHATVGYGKAFLRSLIEVIFRLTVILGIIDLLFPLWDSKRQTLHDKIVGTVVLW